MPEATRSSVVSNRVLWSVVAIGFGVMFLSSSIKGAYQVYFRDLAELYELGRGHFALTGALFGLALGVVSPLVGGLCDRFGPFISILSGAVAAAFAFLWLGLSQSFPVFLIAYGVVAAYALAAMTFVPMGVLIDRLFTYRNKGLAYAAVSNGVAIGFILLSPLWVWLNTWLSWQQLALALSLTFLLLIAVPFYWAGKRLPLGREAPESPSGAEASEGLAPGGPSLEASETRGERLLPHLQRLPFVLLAVSFAGCGASMAFIDMHFVPLLQERTGSLDPGGTASLLAMTLSLLGLMELIGAVWVGFLVGRQPPAVLLAVLYGVRAAVLAMLAFATEPWQFLAFAALFGATYMGTVIITSMMCLQCYGARIKGKMFGMLFSVHQVAVFLTAYLGGLSHDLTGDYTMTTLGVVAATAFSAVAALYLHPVWDRHTDATQEDTPVLTPGNAAVRTLK